MEETLVFATDLLNTRPGASRSGLDELSTVAQLHAFLDANRFAGRRERTADELASVVVVRDRIRAFWTVDRDTLAVAIDEVLRRSDAHPRLVRHDEFDWHIHAVPLDAPLANRIEVEIALALVDVIRATATDRLRECEADDCDGVLVDLSRNGSKRFCSVRCGNRMNMVAWRARQG